MKFGINLYGVLKDRKDTLAALKELRELGYRRIEPCVAPAEIKGWEHVFWPVSWLEEDLEEIRALDLEIVSAHLIGWNGTLYGKPLQVELLRFLREERRFDGVAELRRQIEADIQAAKSG